MPSQGKCVIVTGAARGIGKAIAERFAHDGAQVVIADVDEAAGEETAANIENAGGQARFIKCDVGQRLDVRNLITQTVNACERIDVLINNAGVTHAAEFLDIEEEDFDRVLNINLKGAFLAGQAAARQMVKQIGKGGKPGTIINLSSVNAVFALPNQVPYSISKGGVNQLTKVMALSLAPHGIRVNAIGPGSIMTEMFESVVWSDPAARGKVLSRTPAGRIGDPAEIAAVAAFLASDEASYITGQTIYADGGRLPLNYTVPVNTD
ncbi:MAG: SDR family NAD(P)-dependent oxidoreductase [Tepidamorphaceae bacterium]|nr:SDR family oxidoreductase [Rhodobiaceae bacterium]MCC0048274.1 SDR family oxidoreductase [Rhodobiaceae bacterium]